jgi:GTP cyclohydrolase IA
MANEPSDSQVARRKMIEKFLKGVTATPWTDNGLSDKMKVARIQKHMASVMKTLGLDLTDDSLADTPLRIAKMYVYELFKGLNPDNFPKITCIENKMKVDEMVSVSSIRVLSVCEHHFVTIDGYATVAYIPGKKVIGLSKINRVVRFFAQRPQVQERLTTQIADCLQNILETENVAVHLKAKHYCVISRGVEDTESETTTTVLRGLFKTDSATRSEFLRTTKR